MKRREFLAAGAVALPLAGVAIARGGGEQEKRKPTTTPARPLTLPESGRARVAFAVGAHTNVIDLAGPWEVFQDVGAETGGSSPFELLTVAETQDEVEGTGGLRLLPHYTYADAPDPHVIVVPAHHATDATRAWLAKAAAKAEMTMSVCTGAYILAEAGLLDGRTATTHHGFHDDFERTFPRVKLVRTARYVEHERIATAAGLTSGIDLALRVVERYLGRGAATNTARYLEHAA